MLYSGGLTTPFFMWKLIATTAVAVGVGVLPALSDPIRKNEWYTPHAQGCMMMRECTEDVHRIYSSGDLRHHFPDSNWDTVSREFDQIMLAFEQIGIEVYLAEEKYFPVGHRGVYYTVGNNFFLNKRFMHRPHVLMSVTRHEGWHAAQDCMAGTIDNSMIAIIMDEDKVPQIWQDIASDTYKNMPKAIPWEKEAFWAGKTEGMTQAALQACAAGEMWKVYEPTPLTREWLEKNGYLP